MAPLSALLLLQEKVSETAAAAGHFTPAAYLGLHALHLFLSSQQLLAQKLHLRIRLWEIQF